MSDLETYEGYEDVEDRGPWTVTEWPAMKLGGEPAVVLQSDDFNHDVCLIVTGDFWDREQKVLYAEALAARLNLTLEQP